GPGGLRKARRRAQPCRLLRRPSVLPGLAGKRASCSTGPMVACGTWCFRSTRRRARLRTLVSSPSERRWPAQCRRASAAALLLGVTDADDELAHRLILLHGGVRLLDLRQLVDLM